MKIMHSQTFQISHHIVWLLEHYIEGFIYFSRCFVIFNFSIRFRFLRYFHLYRFMISPNYFIEEYAKGEVMFCLLRFDNISFGLLEFFNTCIYLYLPGKNFYFFVWTKNDPLNLSLFLPGQYCVPNISGKCKEILCSS